MYAHRPRRGLSAPGDGSVELGEGVGRTGGRCGEDGTQRGFFGADRAYFLTGEEGFGYWCGWVRGGRREGRVSGAWADDVVGFFAGGWGWRGDHHEVGLGGGLRVSGCTSLNRAAVFADGAETGTRTYAVVRQRRGIRCA